MSQSVIVSAKRTPMGSFQGALSPVSAPRLGAVVIQSLLKEAGLNSDAIQDVILGNVITAGEGQAPARQAALYAGLSPSTSCLTINKVCGSGLKAVMLADQAIRCGDVNTVIAGGMENMSQAPHALMNSRSGLRLGNGELKDLMVHDGLWDPHHNCHMGNIAEGCVKEYSITREAQDEYAKLSYERAQKAIADGKFKNEICVVEVPQRKGDALKIDTDEEPARAKLEKLPSLRPAFDKQGTVTAGNASSINDGAAAVLVMSEDEAKAKNLKPLVKIVATAQASLAPEQFTVAPATAMQKVLEKAGLKSDDIDLWEVNEAFAVVAMVNNQKLNIPIEKVNVNGGAVALGHPIGASGCRILVTLIHELLKRNDARYGLASLCIGGGEAVAMIIEKC